MDLKRLEELEKTTLAEFAELPDNYIRLQGDLAPTQTGAVKIVSNTWSAILDKHTCDLCRSLDGKTMAEGDPAFDEYQPPIHDRCFIDEKVKIYTSQGWKPIGKIQVGDLVLTHNGRFKKVIVTFREKSYRGEVVKIKWKNFGVYPRQVTTTPEHEFLINGKWVEIKDVKVGDKVSMMATPCHRCGKLKPHPLKYCSHSCLSKDITDRQWSNPEHRANVSRKNRISMITQYAFKMRDPYKGLEKAHEKCRELFVKGSHPLQEMWKDPKFREKVRKAAHTPEINKMHSERMKRKNPSHSKRVRKKITKSYLKTLRTHPEKHPNYILAQKGHKTTIEKLVGTALYELGYEPEYNYHIDKYWVDWALPEYNLAIECDGHYWHNEDTAIKDAKRQKIIENNGWTVLRFGEDRIHEDVEGCKQEIANVLKNHRGEYKFVDVEVQSVEQWKLKKHGRRLYNFQVEDDESYIANGIISKNCRCLWIGHTEESPYKPPINWEPPDPGLVDEFGGHWLKDLPEKVLPEVVGVPEELKKLLPEKEWIENLSEIEKEAIESWAAGASDAIRGYQKYGKVSGIKEMRYTRKQIIEYVEAMEKSVNQASPYNGTIWRALANLTEKDANKLLNTEIFEWDAFSSGTISKGFATRRLAYGEKDTWSCLLKIRSKTGVKIDNAVQEVFKHEKEVLMKRGTKYKQIGSRKFIYTDTSTGFKYNAIEINLEEII